VCEGVESGGASSAAAAAASANVDGDAANKHLFAQENGRAMGKNNSLSERDTRKGKTEREQAHRQQLLLYTEHIRIFFNISY